MSQPNMLSCREVIEQLWAFIDGELDSEQLARVDLHLEACASCFPHYDFQRAFQAFLRAHNAQPVPAALRRRIFMSLLAEESSTPTG